MPKSTGRANEHYELMYAQAQERLIEAYNTLNSLEANIKEVNDKLSSFALSTWEFLGLASGTESENDLSDNLQRLALFL